MPGAVLSIYKVLLSRDTFYRFNRFALLGLMVVSLVVPFIELQAESESYVPDVAYCGYQTLVYTVSELPATVEDSAVSFLGLMPSCCFMCWASWSA